MKDWTNRFDFQHKMNLITMLQERGIIGRELIPISYDFRTVAYWHFEVLKPEELPDYFKVEFELFGEIRC